LRATTDTHEAVLASDVVFVIVPTPSTPGGGFSLDHARAACDVIGAALREKDDFAVVVMTSTVMPGATGGDIQNALETASGRKAGVDFGLCYSPEFIALGSVVRNFLNPDFVLIGESDERAGGILAGIYADVVENGAPAARMNFVNAELAKLAVNTYVTTKIAFANMLARLCERLPGADVAVVADTLGLDTRIGRKYLTGAMAYGGPCFPRDNAALAALARSVGAPATIAEATDGANRAETKLLADLVETHLPEQGRVAILGLSYKPDTNVVDESPGLHLVQELAERGHDVVAYDPVAMDAAARATDDPRLEFATSAGEAASGAQVVVITTPWREFESISWAGPGTLIDCWRISDPASLADGIQYVTLGVGPAPVVATPAVRRD
jgi:UDPglucose 6-dehydrogenase